MHIVLQMHHSVADVCWLSFDYLCNQLYEDGPAVRNEHQYAVVNVDLCKLLLIIAT